MTTVQQPICEANGNLSQLMLSFDDVTLVISRLDWTNPQGIWTITLLKGVNVVQTHVLQPGDSGGVNVPGNSNHWSNTKNGAPDVTISSSWVRA